VEFAATIPAGLRLRRGTTKYIFRRALRGIVPDAVIDRPKRGFAIPLGRWFRGQLREFARDLLLSETSRSRRIFQPGYIEELARRPHKGYEADLDLELWTLISFELWCRTFLDGSQTPRSVERTVGGRTTESRRGPGGTAATPTVVESGGGLRR
jgi:asparagine synthase (glutamine-hydrolysing)